MTSVSEETWQDCTYYSGIVLPTTERKVVDKNYCFVYGIKTFGFISDFLMCFLLFVVTDLLFGFGEVPKVTRESICLINIFHICSSCSHLSVNMTFPIFNFMRTFYE